MLAWHMPKVRARVSTVGSMVDMKVNPLIFRYPSLISIYAILLKSASL